MLQYFALVLLDVHLFLHGLKRPSRRLAWKVFDDVFQVRLQKMGIESTRVGQGKEVETLSGEAMWNEVKRAGTLVPRASSGPFKVFYSNLLM